MNAILFDHCGYQWRNDGTGYYIGVEYLGQFIFVVLDKNLVAIFTNDLSGTSFYAPGYCWSILLGPPR